MRTINQAILLTTGCLLFVTGLHADDQPAVQFHHGVHARFVEPKPEPAEGGGGQDPLAIIAEEMGDITHDLGARKTAETTQHKQQVVVGQLDEIIKQLEAQCKGSGSGKGRNPSKPMQDSKISHGPGGMGELIRPNADQKTIGNLPAKERDRIQQSKTEGFPPGYEALLSSYYTKLAQEKAGGDDASDKPAAPATRPSKPQ